MRDSTTIHDTLARCRRIAFAVGVVALVIALAAGFFQPTQFFRSYLYAWVPLWALCLGALALVMIHHLTGGVWGLVVRRILEAQMSTLPLVGLLFLPVLMGLPSIYPWASPEREAEHWSEFRLQYLETWFVAARWIIYFLVWGLLVICFRRWSARQDHNASAGPPSAARNVAGPGLVLYGLSLHFSSIDWLMSIDSHFTSTAYAPIVVSVQLLSAFCCMLVTFAAVSRRQEIQAALSTQVLSDLGNLLLALVSIWTYLLWFQYMLIWMADLRHDNVWYLHRRGGWQAVAWILALAGFVGPFFALLLRSVKRSTRGLASVAMVILLVQALFIAYQLLPSLGLNSLAEIWLAPVLLVGLVGIWSAAFLWLLETQPLVPVNDRNWPHALELRELDAEHHEREEALDHA